MKDERLLMLLCRNNIMHMKKFSAHMHYVVLSAPKKDYEYFATSSSNFVSCTQWNK